MEISYRLALPSDAAELAQVRYEFLAENHTEESAEARTAMLDALRDYFDRALTDGSFLAFVALDGDRIVGTSGLVFYDSPPNWGCPDGRIAYIMNMYTKPACRGHGIATKLFALIVDEAAKRGYSKITLNASPMGRPIYEKYGFTDVAGDMAYHVK